MFLLIGLTITCLSMALSMLMLGGDVYNLIDIPSLTILICSILGLLTATRSFKVFYAGFMAAILPKREITEDMRGRAASLFRLLSKTTMLTAVIAVLICTINICVWGPFSDSRGASVWGINISTIFMTLFWAMLFTVTLFEPVVFILKKRGTGKR